MIALSLIGIIYGALVSLMQKDMKKLVAYSSVSHLGFCTLGIFALNAARAERIGAAADQSRHLDRRALLDCRHSLRTPSHARDCRVRRHLQRDAGLRDHHDDHVPLVDGPAAAQRFRRRVHHPARHVHGKLALGRMGGAGRGACRGVSAVALSARLLRHGHESQEREAARPHAARSG
jgi:hypothetical protein